jgi:hypothetical protein
MNLVAREHHAEQVAFLVRIERTRKDDWFRLAVQMDRNFLFAHVRPPFREKA